MFRKLVAIEPVSLIPSAEKELHSYADEVVMYPDIPAGDEEIIARIGDADAVLLSYTSRINRAVLEECTDIKYIGMCCSLYSPESANVDIRYANELMPDYIGFVLFFPKSNRNISIEQAEDYLREFLPVPAEHGILCAVALGYSDFEPAALPPFDAGTHIHWPEK